MVGLLSRHALYPAARGFGGVALMKTTTYTIDWSYAADKSLADFDLLKFRKWASCNADVMEWLYNVARTNALTGKKTSVRRLFEWMRWDSGIRISGYDADVAMRNDYAPLVARILIKSVPDFSRCITCKKSRYDLLDDSQLPTFDKSGRLVWDDAS